MSNSMKPPAPEPGAPPLPMLATPDAVAQRKRQPQISPDIHDQLRPTLQEEEERRYEVSRIVNFSDGVFAFAMTLLVINLLPYADFGAAPSTAQFFHQLLSQAFLDHLLSFVVSFYIIGHVWHTHRLLFRYIIRYDVGLFRLNLTLLLCVAFLPFPTDLVGRYGDAITAAFYAGVLALLNVLLLLLWWYASAHHRLIRPTLEQHLITSLRLTMLLTLPLFLIAIGFAFLSQYLAYVTCVATFFVRPLVARKYNSFAEKGARHGQVET